MIEKLEKLTNRNSQSELRQKINVKSKAVWSLQERKRRKQRETLEKLICRKTMSELWQKGQCQKWSRLIPSRNKRRKQNEKLEKLISWKRESRTISFQLLYDRHPYQVFKRLCKSLRKQIEKLQKLISRKRQWAN